MNARHVVVGTVVLGTLLALGLLARTPTSVEAQLANPDLPTFEVDPFWPKSLPNNWILGQVAGVAVDARDHVWIVHRPGSLTPNE